MAPSKFCCLGNRALPNLPNCVAVMKELPPRSELVSRDASTSGRHDRHPNPRRGCDIKEIQELDAASWPRHWSIAPNRRRRALEVAFSGLDALSSPSPAVFHSTSPSEAANRMHANSARVRSNVVARAMTNAQFNILYQSPFPVSRTWILRSTTSTSHRQCMKASTSLGLHPASKRSDPPTASDSVTSIMGYFSRPTSPPCFHLQIVQQIWLPVILHDRRAPRSICVRQSIIA